MTEKDALKFVRQHGIVMESARGPTPSLAEAVAGAPIRGSWGSHPRADEIFRLSRVVREHPDVLVCRLVRGKVSFVHRRLWSALVRLADEFPASYLADVREIHAVRKARRPGDTLSEVGTRRGIGGSTEAERIHSARVLASSFPFADWFQCNAPANIAFNPEAGQAAREFVGPEFVIDEIQN